METHVSIMAVSLAGAVFAHNTWIMTEKENLDIFAHTNRWLGLLSPAELIDTVNQASGGHKLWGVDLPSSIHPKPNKRI